MVIKTNGTQKESQILDIATKPKQSLHYDIEYDTTNPESTMRDFVKDIQGMLNRFEGNRARIFEIEAELNDLEHYMEIGNYKNVPEGYKLYRKLAELRRERRACKNENDLLKPIYDYFHATDVLPKLTNVQGEVSKVKNAIDMRVYSVRTSVLDEFLNKEPKESKESKEEEEIA